MKKRILISISALIAVVFVSGFAFYFNKHRDSGYITVPAKVDTIVEAVEASGTVNPVNTVDIGSQVSGMIKDIYVDYNSKVTKGQLLAQIDPSLFQAQVDKARGDLEAARSNKAKIQAMLVYDKKNYERYKRLYEKNYVAKSDLDLAEATYKSDLAQIAAAQGTINQAQATLNNNLTNLRYTKIVSPVDGIVVSRAVDVGQTVAASFQTPTLFQVAQDLTNMQIEVNVSEADIGKIKKGQEVEYTLDGYADSVFHGKVTEVRIAPTTVSNVVTYTVIVDVDNKDQKMIPGMTANASIITNKSENVICVPTDALKFTPKEITGGKKYKEQGLWILRNNKPTRISIETGAKDSDRTEIISKELKENDRVIISKKGDKDKTAQGKRPPMRMF
ncbi:efflux transporter RND family MFP subunit [Clostridium sp. CAG:306]|jgi:efflux transporter, RND family, MFP subunit|nr:efflux RND transporter periplasmic adaptor subunit [Clostridium sp.]CDC18472.1 efflux transporter RND family MFP subunit [Clostridium sp. CAG:306]DAB20377.1 MAG TPA: efflux RND transporter periplasmic adaptor subunit [Candidatus Gastranaerophilales bacterium HUM_21]